MLTHLVSAPRSRRKLAVLHHVIRGIHVHPSVVSLKAPRVAVIV
jgi:hypothetical protein